MLAIDSFPIEGERTTACMRAAMMIEIGIGFTQTDCLDKRKSSFHTCSDVGCWQPCWQTSGPPR